MDNMIKRAANLLSVKSIVTLMLTGVFIFLAVRGSVDGEDFMSVFLMVVSFYFGTQSQKLQDAVGGGAAREDGDAQ